MDSRNEQKIVINPQNNEHSYYKNQEIPLFYSTFDNFMKNKIKNGMFKNKRQNDKYNFSELMNSLHEYNKKKSSVDLTINPEKGKKQKLFNGILLQNFNDTSLNKKYNIFIKKKNSYLINSKNCINRNNEEKEKNNFSKEQMELFLNEIKILENLEIIINKIIENRRNSEEFFLHCNLWIKEFENTKWINSNIIKVKRINNEINEKEKSINMLIISLIISILKLNQFNDNSDSEIIIKDLSEILIFHRKIFLLLCFDLLLGNNFIPNNNNNFLFEQIKLFLPLKINTLENNSSIDKELKSFNNIFYSILKPIVFDYIEKYENNEGLNNLDNIFILNSKQLINLFKNIYNLKAKENRVNKMINTINTEQTIKPLIYYRNKKLIKKRYLIDEKELYNASENNTFNNYCQNSNNMKNNKIFKMKNKNYFNSSNTVQNKTNNEIEKINYNSYFLKNNQSLNNSSSCKVIPIFAPSLVVESNKKLNNNYLNSISLKDINEPKKINNISATDLLRGININKPKPPFLSQNVLSSKFNKKIFTLVLDLDETLIKYQQMDYSDKNGKVVFRPGLIQFLNKISPFSDLIIWTVATKTYADKIINNIEKNKKYFFARLYREHCSYKNKIYVKDLANLGRPLDKIIIIDDKENNFSLQRDNGILIKPFHGTKWECQNDYILMDLYNILTKIIFDRSKDVRIGINKYKKDILQKISQINKENSQINRNS